MQLGTGLFTCQQRPDDDRSMTEIHDEMLELGRTIDEAGLDSTWVSEHHFSDDSYLSGTMPALGALASVTDNIEIGTCIALAPLYDGVRLAEDAATVDLLSDGRLTLGLSIGSNPNEFEQFGVPREERVERLSDQVNLLRGAWSDGPLDYDAEFHDVSPDVTVTPKPKDGVPIMLGGAAKPAVRRAARTADAWCAPSKLSITGLQRRVEDIRNVRETEDIDGEFQIYILQHGWVGDSREDAWETMKDGYLYIQRRYAEIFGGEPVDELPAERKQELKEQAIFGTPDQVVDELNEYREALGDDIHFVFRTYHPGVGTEAMKTCIQRLGEEVAPRV
ncbi:flavin-dependent oxidoreductase, F420-dependent methylene-tetrahydromethanopterin reductase [Halogeometricum borinquense DSM 11551]|uniref:Flavin-dependent oxidoreductase, F420-dependent methylene-tetrahydromethanopterin reductase n=2 Tax=Halogeometricum borinquense TaxID=60847 RepID=E4NV55_HALBP|nr:LLM class flavin-dependent oxidoreductase [Halogeometricum borinquense]ADQ69044.1 flavin-dependent oxidoreductase, F420-dependent methylene-tetrahydromethanopterin reductase [Halogeometricum borinquense DSM 11551]ELY29454.1 flavin-dependent oxidoreductase, F420-dependent methylene-tetrahydromethanopterin reductase [Halogeometricum borinquense DSM 11551]RYJ08213.1 LLM class flavin-dependent oxidoreductase [Halogeometricum borinquense]